MPKTISAEEFDRLFDEGGDVSEYVDWSAAHRPGQDMKRVNVDFPAWMVEALDKEAKRRGVTRQSLIKNTLCDFLDTTRHRP